ncbi:MAG: acyl-CoA carboxylase subunit epsilon [Nocardioidaceae bacterium]|nr:acyl-CoA carboxylase subunit epsilon [Nocardioidaceae bacterium]
MNTGQGRDGDRLTVVRGLPTDAELAALITVVAARSAARGDPLGEDVRTHSRWADPARRLRPSLRPGRGAWGGSTQSH